MTAFAKKMMSSTIQILIAIFLFTSVTVHAETFDHEHSAWNLLVKNHVHWDLKRTASKVDYAGFLKNHDFLKRYLYNLSAVSRTEFDGFSRDQQLAFLINAYNAFTVELILTDYPGLESIKDLGSFFSSPWKKKFFLLFGEAQSLDGIEHDLIRGSGRYNEPLIHFAVNCASIGCPALLDEAFTAERLNQQLLVSTQRFLNDRSRNRFEADVGILKVSSIFNWYAEDFARGWRGYESLQDFFRTHANWIASDKEGVERMVEGPLKIEFLDYNWGLNSLR